MEIRWDHNIFVFISLFEFFPENSEIVLRFNACQLFFSLF